jgi:hypothetical protein
LGLVHNEVSMGILRSVTTTIHPAPSARNMARPSAVSANMGVAPSCSDSAPWTSPTSRSAITSGVAAMSSAGA